MKQYDAIDYKYSYCRMMLPLFLLVADQAKVSPHPLYRVGSKVDVDIQGKIVSYSKEIPRCSQAAAQWGFRHLRLCVEKLRKCAKYEKGCPQVCKPMTRC
eukprot:2052963-Amphidinium_carterae.2